MKSLDFSSLARAAVAAEERSAPAVADSVEGLLTDLTQCGFNVETDGENLWVRPSDRLTPNQKERIKRMKSAIIAELHGKRPALAPAGWDQAAADAALTAALRRVDALESLASDMGPLALFDCERAVLRRFHRTFDPFLFESEIVHLAIRRNILEMRATR